jgi:hypothetical protein
MISSIPIHTKQTDRYNKVLPINKLADMYHIFIPKIYYSDNRSKKLE